MIRKLIRDANRQKENGHELSVSYSYLYQNPASISFKTEYDAAGAQADTIG